MLSIKALIALQKMVTRLRKKIICQSDGTSLGFGVLFNSIELILRLKV